MHSGMPVTPLTRGTQKITNQIQQKQLKIYQIKQSFIPFIFENCYWYSHLSTFVCSQSSHLTKHKLNIILSWVVKMSFIHLKYSKLKCQSTTLTLVSAIVIESSFSGLRTRELLHFLPNSHFRKLQSLLENPKNNGTSQLPWEVNLTGSRTWLSWSVMAWKWSVVKM